MSLLTLTTLIATVVATIATAVAWRVWRSDRARAAARTRALGAAIDGRVGLDESSASWAASESAEPRLEVAGPDDRPLFASAVTGGHPSSWLAPAMGVGAIVVASAVVALLFAGGSPRAATDAAGPTPIDLLSMRHIVETRNFVVTGLVRNPATAGAREGVSAVVFCFDGKGSFITSARAPLEFATLSPGDESPFLVTIPRPAGLERYRLSFRLADGTVLPHVDQREEK